MVFTAKDIESYMDFLSEVQNRVGFVAMVTTHPVEGTYDPTQTSIFTSLGSRSSIIKIGETEKMEPTYDWADSKDDTDLLVCRTNQMIHPEFVENLIRSIEHRYHVKFSVEKAIEAIMMRGNGYRDGDRLFIKYEVPWNDPDPQFDENKWFNIDMKWMEHFINIADILYMTPPRMPNTEIQEPALKISMRPDFDYEKIMVCIDSMMYAQEAFQDAINEHGKHDTFEWTGIRHIMVVPGGMLGVTCVAHYNNGGVEDTHTFLLKDWPGKSKETMRLAADHLIQTTIGEIEEWRYTELC